jgi:hypothetical protein
MTESIEFLGKTMERIGPRPDDDAFGIMYDGGPDIFVTDGTAAIYGGGLWHATVAHGQATLVIKEPTLKALEETTERHRQRGYIMGVIYIGPTEETSCE